MMLQHLGYRISAEYDIKRVSVKTVADKGYVRPQNQKGGVSKYGSDSGQNPKVSASFTLYI